MYYKINPEIALRSWTFVPHAYYIYGQRSAQKLTAEQFELLLRCDGVTDLEASPLLLELLEQRLAVAVDKGDVPSQWSAYKACFNRYFRAIQLTITSKCNYNCRHCFMAADNAPTMSELSYQECVDILDQCVACGIQTVTLTGGEPLLHPHFLNIVKACADRHLFLHDINTNGSLITAKLLDEMKEMGVRPRIKISFDGLGHHDWMRGSKGTEEKTLQAIRLCLEKGYRVEVQTNVHRGNADVIFETAKYLSQMGVGQMRIIRTTESPRWIHNEHGESLDIEEYYQVMLDFSASYIAADLPMEIDIWQFLSLFPENKTYHYRPIVLSGHTYRDNFPVCGGTRSMVSVISSGEVVPCSQMSGYYEKNNISLGNIHQTPLKDLLTDSLYLEKVTCPISEIKKQNPKCGACPYWQLCAGGCRAIALALTNKELAPDPAKCLFFHHNWMEKISTTLKAANPKYQNCDTLNGRPVNEIICK